MLDHIAAYKQGRHHQPVDHRAEQGLPVADMGGAEHSLCQQKLGQQLRINRSKIKDTSDTNSDFDDLDSAIRSGYFLKEGLANTRISIT